MFLCINTVNQVFNKQTDLILLCVCGFIFRSTKNPSNKTSLRWTLFKTDAHNQTLTCDVGSQIDIKLFLGVSSQKDGEPPAYGLMVEMLYLIWEIWDETKCLKYPLFFLDALAQSYQQGVVLYHSKPYVYRFIYPDFVPYLSHVLDNFMDFSEGQNRLCRWNFPPLFCLKSECEYSQQEWKILAGMTLLLLLFISFLF